MDCLPINHAVQKRPTLTAVSTLNDWWYNQFGEHDPQHQGKGHKDQKQADTADLYYNITAMVQGGTGRGFFTSWHHRLPLR
jgi:hypothetical protein